MQLFYLDVVPNIFDRKFVRGRSNYFSVNDFRNAASTVNLPIFFSFFLSIFRSCFQNSNAHFKIFNYFVHTKKERFSWEKKRFFMGEREWDDTLWKRNREIFRAALNCSTRERIRQENICMQHNHGHLVHLWHTIHIQRKFAVTLQIF